MEAFGRNNVRGQETLAQQQTRAQREPHWSAAADGRQGALDEALVDLLAESAAEAAESESSRGDARLAIQRAKTVEYDLWPL
jgi:hypothetical protein